MFHMKCIKYNMNVFEKYKILKARDGICIPVCKCEILQFYAHYFLR